MCAENRFVFQFFVGINRLWKYVVLAENNRNHIRDVRRQEKVKCLEDEHLRTDIIFVYIVDGGNAYIMLSFKCSL